MNKMEFITIICDGRSFKTRRKNVSNLFGSLPHDLVNLVLDTDPDHFEEILEDLRESSDIILHSAVEYYIFKDRVKDIKWANIELDVGGKTFHTTRDTLYKSDYFKAMFEWDNLKPYPSSKNTPIFIDKEPDKFRSILNYLRGLNTDPGPYADYFMIQQSKKKYQVNENIGKSYLSPLIIQDEPLKIVNPDKLPDYLAWNNPLSEFFQELNNLSTTTYTEISSEHKIEHEIKLYNQSHFICGNFRLVTNTGIRTIRIEINDNVIYRDHARNSYMFSNIKNIPNLLIEYGSIILRIGLTRRGFCQVIFNKDKAVYGGNRYDRTVQNYKLPKAYQHTYYYGRDKKISHTSYSHAPYGMNTIGLIIRKNPDYDKLIIKYGGAILAEIDDFAHAQYHKENPNDSKDNYYIKLDADVMKHIHNRFTHDDLILNYVTDIWVVNENLIQRDNRNHLMTRYLV